MKLVQTVERTMKYARMLSVIAMLIATEAGAAAPAPKPAPAPLPTLITQAKVTKEQAEKTALASVPGGKIRTSELGKERDKMTWSFGIARANSKVIKEVRVDAMTGKIVESRAEAPAAVKVPTPPKTAVEKKPVKHGKSAK